MAEDVLLPCFFYGTLMFDSVYLRVVSQGAVKVTEVPRSQKAVLRGYRRCCVRDRKYPALIVDRANANPRSVEGVLRWVPESHMFWLDDWEEVEYERRTVVVDVSGSDPIEAITYVWILDDSVELLPDDWSAQTFETEHLPGWIADADANGKLDWLGFELDGSASSAAAPE
ncbi:hypothetical protein DFJ74DRAFT_683303 [Hyaloraphidium curvatum]|nr:hypothetical protein DFJ74DRAFT_683303 [Hyaloraphidium curvatum]